jgi:hypothetical protein
MEILNSSRRSLDLSKAGRDFHHKRQEEISAKETSPSFPSQQYIHPKSGEYNRFPSRIGSASPSNDVHHLF